MLLVLGSAATYVLRIAVFGRTENTFYYMVQDLAFVPVQVLLVTRILIELLSRREKRSGLDKQNMGIGVFISEIGTELRGAGRAGSGWIARRLGLEELQSARWRIDLDLVGEANTVQRTAVLGQVGEEAVVVGVVGQHRAPAPGAAALCGQQQ